MDCPWNSPGQNTGVRSLSLLQGNLSNLGIEQNSPTLQINSQPAEPQGKPKVKVKVAQLCLILCDPMDCPWNSPGQNTGVGGLSLLQGIFPTQESNQGLLHCRQILYQLRYQGSPIIEDNKHHPSFLPTFRTN